MAEAVVDLLEEVDVGDADMGLQPVVRATRAGASRLGGGEAAQLLVEGAAVGEAGEFVGVGVVQRGEMAAIDAQHPREPRETLAVDFLVRHDLDKPRAVRRPPITGKHVEPRAADLVAQRRPGAPGVGFAQRR